jgi:assimilatory nitrate reductase catalytic subunit
LARCATGCCSAKPSQRRSDASVTGVIRTTCPYCGVGCGLTVRSNAATLSLSGDPQHPANQGRLCSKGAALADTLDLKGRLLTPRIGGLDVGWDEALNHIAERFGAIVREHGPESVAFYVSGQLLTEDYYVANKLMKGYIGSANIDTNSRLCMSSAVAAHKRAFGEDLVPVQYQDLECAELIVLVGSNTAWCHPVLFQRILRAKERRPELKIVVIDPRRTSTCEIADLHLPVSAGSDVWLFNGLLEHLHREGCTAKDFVTEHTAGAEQALAAARESSADPEVVARRCGIQSWALEEFYQLFARSERVITAFSQGVNQSSCGTDKANSIINCHLLTGRIGRSGMGPFSVTGQPNAMGGREVGGLANVLAAHMDLENVQHRQIVQQFWNSPRIAMRPGLKAVELFESIHAGRVKAVWIAATNPVVSLPNANRVREALERCDLVVVSDCVASTDTTALAHVLLPAAAWGEKDGTVTNSERCISRQRSFLPLPGLAKPDWWMWCEIARRMGFGEAFNYRSPAEIFCEHARLSAAQNHGTRAFDISALGELSCEAYDDLAPTLWPLRADAAAGTTRLFADRRFFHTDGRGRLGATPPRDPAHVSNESFPFVLNTGRVRDQWHTMTRTGKAARLNLHSPEPYVDMHEKDALVWGLRPEQLVRVATHWGSMVGRLRVSGDMPQGMVFTPIHWSDACSSDARVGALVSPAVDPISGEPEFKHTPARVAPFFVDWYAFILSRKPRAIEQVTWWNCSQGTECIRYELAGRGALPDWSQWGKQLLGALAAESDWLEYRDDGSGIFRAAYVLDERLEGCLFLSPRADLPSRVWLSGLFAKKTLSDADRANLLTGQAPGAVGNAGTTVCSCFGVGRDSICKAIRKFKLTTPSQIGHRLRAGTNCGSCLPEIRAILEEEAAAATELRRLRHCEDLC